MVRLDGEGGIDDMIEAVLLSTIEPYGLPALLTASLIQTIEPRITFVEFIRQLGHLTLVVVHDRDRETFAILEPLHLLLDEAYCEHCRSEPVVRVERLGMTVSGCRIEGNEGEANTKNLSAILNGKFANSLQKRLAFSCIDCTPAAFAVDKSACLKVGAISLVRRQII